MQLHRGAIIERLQRLLFQRQPIHKRLKAIGLHDNVASSLQLASIEIAEDATEMS